MFFSEIVLAKLNLRDLFHIQNHENSWFALEILEVYEILGIFEIHEKVYCIVWGTHWEDNRLERVTWVSKRMDHYLQIEPLVDFSRLIYFQRLLNFWRIQRLKSHRLIGVDEKWKSIENKFTKEKMRERENLHR